MSAKLTNVNGGIAGLNKALRKLPKVASAELRDASRGIAQMVADDAQGRAKRLGGLPAIVAPTIRAASDRVPVVRMGSTGKLPTSGGSWARSRGSSGQTIGDVMWGAEFGGQRRETTSQGGSTMQFEPWRGVVGGGYFLWPAVRDDSDEINARYSDALLTALRKVG